MINLKVGLNTFQTKGQSVMKLIKEHRTLPVRLDLKLVVTPHEPYNHRTELD